MVACMTQCGVDLTNLLVIVNYAFVCGCSDVLSSSSYRKQEMVNSVVFV